MQALMLLRFVRCMINIFVFCVNNFALIRILRNNTVMDAGTPANKNPNKIFNKINNRVQTTDFVNSISTGNCE